MVLDIFFLALLSISLVYLGLQLALTWYRHRYLPAGERLRGHLPAVSILKPLKGVDDQLAGNLESFFRLDYPDYQLVFGVGDPRDPAVAIVRRLIKAHPQVPAVLVCSTSQTSLNPKVNNLVNMYGECRHNLLLISDSNVRVDPSYLRTMVRALRRDRVGLVTSTIRGVEAARLGSTLENLHLNTFVASSIYVTEHVLRVPAAVGKSMLFRRDTLERIGGFSAFADVLAEDYLIGLAVEELGLKVTTTTEAIENVNSGWSMKQFLNRHTRWAKIRRHLSLRNYLAEAVGNPLAVAALYALVRFDAAGLALFGVAALVKTLCDILIGRMVGGDLRLHHFLLVPLKDLLIGMIWYIPFFSRQVSWRGNAFRIRKHTRLEPVVQH